MAQPFGLGWSLGITGWLGNHRHFHITFSIIIGLGHHIVHHLAIAGSTSRLIMVIIIDFMGSSGEQPM